MKRLNVLPSLDIWRAEGLRLRRLPLVGVGWPRATMTWTPSPRPPWSDRLTNEMLRALTAVIAPLPYAASFCTTPSSRACNA